MRRWLVAIALAACSRDGPKAPASAFAVVADVPLPGNSVRFDYQELDGERNHLVVAHMNDGTALVLDAGDGHVVKELPNIPRARGVAVGDGRIFITSSLSPNKGQLVIVDATTLNEVGRVATGNGPDGVAYDPEDHLVAVSDQEDGAVSIIADKGSGARTAIPLGKETGNVVYAQHAFWAAIVNEPPPDELVRIDPTTHAATGIALPPNCKGAHGLRLHPNGKSAFVVCEDNDLLVRVELGGGAQVTAATGHNPDVLSIDPALGWLYVAAESGDLVVYDIDHPGLSVVAREHPGDHAHSVAVDPKTHRVFFPLLAGANGKPVMRIMKPAGK
jgi:DNA-binding beta-propeller fold protein YncE